MVKRILHMLLIGCALWPLWQWEAVRRRRLERRRGTPAAKPAEVTRWEGEGGALPVTGSQLGPAPERR